MLRTLLLCLALVGAGCSGPASTSDAGPGTPDAGPTVSWTAGPDHPVPIAFGAAMVMPWNGTSYLYVLGGADGSYPALGSIYANVRRAPIRADHSLGDWEDAGGLNNGMMPIPLAGFGAILIHEDGTGAPGVAVAGGGTRASADNLPLVLASYVDSLAGTLGTWGRFEPMLTMGQGFGAFMPFASHDLALVGGMMGGTPTDRVVIAPIMSLTPGTPWIDGPPLPQPRFGHASAMVNEVAYVIGGANLDGTRGDVLRSMRDGAARVSGWTRATLLDTPLVFPSAAAVEDRLYVFGGVAGPLAGGGVTGDVRVARIDPSGAVGDFAIVAGATLPTPVAAPLVARDGNYVYVVGGLTGADLHAIPTVQIGFLP